MKTVRLFAAAAFALAFVSSIAHAQTATQTVTFSVSAINQITVSGDPSALTLAAAAPGSDPTPVTNTATTYSITTNESNKKITASIPTAMPAGVTLTVALAAPSGAATTGAQALSTTAANLVTGISSLNASGLGITYTLSATAAAGTVASQSRVVTFTVITGP
jgi:hypothetical protein